MHTQPTTFPADHRLDEPVHRAACVPAINPDRYAAETDDIDIREAAGEFAQPGLRHYWSDTITGWPGMLRAAIERGISACIITEGDPEPEGSELILIRRKPTQMCAQ